MQQPVYSDYAEINNILNYRTSNLGITKLDVDDIPTSGNYSYGVLSYITNLGIVIPNPLPVLSIPENTSPASVNENKIMENIIFNHKIIKYADPILDQESVTVDSKNMINFIIDASSSEVKKYKFGDFSKNIITNCKYYNDNFEVTTIQTNSFPSDKVIDIDLSYYASQNIIRYLIFLDILSEIYRVVSEHNTTKEDIGDALKSVTIRCRYSISNPSDSSSAFKSHDTNYNITFKDLSNINHDSNMNDMVNIISSTTIPSSAETNNKTALNNLINTYFKKELLNHIKYIKKADMIYATHFKNFYKLCRLMLNYNILYCIQYLVAVNVKKISTNPSGTIISYNDSSPEFIEFKTNKGDITTIDDYKTYNKHIRPKSLITTFTTYYNYTDYTGITLDENIAITSTFNTTGSLTTTSSSYKTISYNNILTTPNNNKTYRIISINNSSTFMSKPCGKIISYKTNEIILSMDNVKKKILNINNVVPNIEYFIKLHNFSTKFTSSQTGDATSTNIKWYNETKILHILKSNQDRSILISALNIYIIKFVDAVVDVPASFNISNDFTTVDEKFSILIPSTFTSSATGIAVNNGLVTITLQINAAKPILDDNVITAIKSQDNVFKYDIPSASEISGQYNGLYIINVKSLSFKDIDDEIILGLVCNYARTSTLQTDATFNEINGFYINTPSSSCTIGGVTNYPCIQPLSFEKDTHLSKITKTDNTPVYYINDYYYKILSNFKNSIENFNLESTTDTDEIITKMSQLDKINQDLNKNSSDLKKNYSNFKDENTKVLSSNTLDIIVIILFVITLFSALYIPLTSFNKNTKTIMAGGLFCLVLIVFIIIYIIIYAQYNELFTTSSEYKIDSTPISNKFKDIITVLKNNFFNTRIRISQKIILPAIKNEKLYFEDKNKKFDIYKSISLSDYRIQKRTRLNNINRITFFLHITLIIATALILYILLPEYWQIILGIFIILIILSLLLYYIKLVNIVHTNPNNIYWSKPETSLKGL